MPGLFDTPFTNLLYDNSNALMSAASAINPQARTFAGAMRPAFGAFAQGKMVDEQMGQVRREEQERQAQMQQEQALRERYTQFFTEQNRPDLARGVADSLYSPAEAYGEWMSAQNGGNDANYGLTPIWGVDANGNPTLAQMSSQGGIRPVDMPEGFQPGRDPIRMDAGDRWILLDPVTRQTIGEVPKSGDVPTGYTPNGDGSIAPMAGGPQEREIAREDRADQNARQQAATYADIVTQDIDRLTQQIEENPLMTTGIGAATTQNIPGTPAFNSKALADTIRANVGFDRLNQMRQASPTGGALGQVSEFENRLLQATIGNLELSQSKEQLLENLSRVREIYVRIINEGIEPGDPIAQGMSGGQQSSGNTTSTGVQWSM